MQVLRWKSILAPAFYGDIKEIYTTVKRKFALSLFPLRKNLKVFGPSGKKYANLAMCLKIKGGKENIWKALF